MSHPTTTTKLKRYVRRPWHDLLRIYYTNTPIWRWLKSAALFFLGFFLWTGGNVLLAVQPEWWFLTYPMAYGFVLILWGPFTHMVIVPVTIRLRRNAAHPVTRWFARYSGKVQFSVFLAIVVVLGTLTPGIMLLEFSGGGGDGGADVSGELACETSEELVSCQVEEPQGIDHVVVTSGGEELRTVEGPPFEFELRRSEIADTRTGKEFTVEFRDAEGNTLRRFIERVD